MQKTIFLTIDDAPSSHLSKKVDFLLRHDIPTILFCRGEFMEKNLDQVVYAIQKGFWIGNHSFTHPHFSTITLEQANEEIDKTEFWIEKAYERAKIIRPHKLFRFPFLDRGEKKGIEFVEALQEMLKVKGFVRLEFQDLTYPDLIEETKKYIDIPCTLEAKEYALFSEVFMKKHGLFEVEDFIKLLEKKDEKKGYDLRDAKSADLFLMHDFETTHHLFEPLLNELLSWNVKFKLPSVKEL